MSGQQTTGDCVPGWRFCLARAAEVSYSGACWGQNGKVTGGRRKTDSLKMCLSTQA